MNTSVVIGTFGDWDHWSPLAERAKESAWNQTIKPDEVIHVHESTLQIARNHGANLARGRWLIFLDADDELDSGYIEAMHSVEGDIRRPSTLGVENGVEDNEAVMIPRKRLIDGNFIVIGAMVERERFLRVGGFDDYPMSEDWALFLKLWCDGAKIVEAPDAIYRVHVNKNSRNSDPVLGARVYREIRQRFLEETKGRVME